MSWEGLDTSNFSSPVASVLEQKPLTWVITVASVSHLPVFPAPSSCVARAELWNSSPLHVLPPLHKQVTPSSQLAKM